MNLRTLLISGMLTMSLSVAADGWKGRPVDFSHGRIMVSENHRFLQHEDGTPFFYLGDTAWELFHRLSREEADAYLSDRASKGFTVIQAVAIAELDGHTVPNAYGHLPLDNFNPASPAVTDGPDNDYWDHVDYIVARANALGMYVGMLPTWGRYRLVATRDTAGTYAMVYVPSGRRFSVNTSQLRGKRLKAWWFCPRDGKVTSIGTFANDGNPLTFAPPTDGELTDWVLVLDDASCRYPAPGSRRWKGDWSL